MKDNKKYGDRTLITLLLIPIISVISLSVLWYLLLSDEDVQELTIDELTVMTEGLDFGLADYQKIMEDYDKRLIQEGLYSVKIPMDNIEEIDPYFWEEYRGYEYNKNTGYAIYRLTDGYYIIIFETDTEEQMVLYANGWESENISLTLSIYDKKEEKSKLLQEYVNTEEPKKKEEILTKIESTNIELGSLFDNVMKTFQ